MLRARSRALKADASPAAKASAAFHTAARKIERSIADVESGHTEGSSDDTTVFNAINKLEDRAYKNWRESGDDAQRTEQDAIVTALRARMRAAVDIGYAARQSRRSGAIQDIKDRERDRITNMTWSERALHRYQQELKAK